MSTQHVPVCTFKTSPCVPAPRAHTFYTCARGARIHGDVLNVHTETWTHGRRKTGVVVSVVFFIGKTSECLTFVEHINRMLVSSLIANFLLTMNGPRKVITCFSCSPKEIPGSFSFFKFENRSRTTCSRFLLSFALPDKAVQLQTHSTAQHSTAQHSTAQHSTAQHSTAQHRPHRSKRREGR